MRIKIFKGFRNTRFVLLYLTGFIFVACSQDGPGPGLKSLPVAEQRSIEVIADDYLRALLKRNPEMGTDYAIPGARHDRLFDNSLTALAEWEMLEDGWLAELDALQESSAVGTRDWVSQGILRETLEASIATRVCRNELWQASSATAWYTYMLSVFEIQPVDSEDHRQQALDRLRQLVHFIDTEISNLRLGLELGYSAPRITVEPSLTEVRALLGEDSPLLSPGIRSGDEFYLKEVQRILDSELGPAIQRYATFVETEYLPRTRVEIGLGHNKHGSSCYPALVRYYATVELPAEKIHQTGLTQIAGIRAEMQSIIDTHFADETIESFLRALNTDPRYTFDTEEEVLNYSLDALEIAKEKVPEVFGLQPKAEVLIKPYPPYRESGTGEYHPSSEDGTRPGIYYIAVNNPQDRSKAIQQSVLYHETYPGHHLQGAIALELGDRVHAIARYLWNSGYAEGWGLYSERLADELGLYNSPLDRMGMLSDQAARASRLVVDTGLHTKGWSRQQAVEYMLANTGWPEIDIESEVNRYIAYPGQATSYMLGMLELMRLRNLAKIRLGVEFSLMDFHDRVLENGSITLPMLDASIKAWVEGWQ